MNDPLPFRGARKSGKLRELAGVRSSPGKGQISFVRGFTEASKRASTWGAIEPAPIDMESTEDKTAALPRHFYSLDALRGVAALVVVFWHWQHFFVSGTEWKDFDRTQQ